MAIQVRRNGAWVDNTQEKKRVNGAWVSNSPYKVMKPTISGVPPFTFKSDGQNLRDWSMSGQVEGVGEKTENLLDTTGAQSGYITDDGTIVSGHANLMYTDYIAIPANTEYMTQSYDNRVTTMDSPSMCFYDSSLTYISGTAFSRSTSKTFPVPNNAVYIRTCYRKTASWNMLNAGSSPLPFEPYGYKIPITCGGTTTNIYLDAPLMDGETISKSSTGVNIPTVSGSNTLSVNTTVQPSGMTIQSISQWV